MSLGLTLQTGKEESLRNITCDHLVDDLCVNIADVLKNKLPLPECIMAKNALPPEVSAQSMHNIPPDYWAERVRLLCEAYGIDEYKFILPVKAIVCKCEEDIATLCVSFVHGPYDH